MFLIILRWIPDAILAYLAFHITLNPLDKNKNKMKLCFFRCLILSCCIFSVVVNLVQYRKQQQQEEAKKPRFSIMLNDITLTNKMTVSLLTNRFILGLCNLGVVEAQHIVVDFTFPAPLTNSITLDKPWEKGRIISIIEKDKTFPAYSNGVTWSVTCDYVQPSIRMITPTIVISNKVPNKQFQVVIGVSSAQSKREDLPIILKFPNRWNE